MRRPPITKDYETNYVTQRHQGRMPKVQRRAAKAPAMEQAAGKASCAKILPRRRRQEGGQMMKIERYKLAAKIAAVDAALEDLYHLAGQLGDLDLASILLRLHSTLDGWLQTQDKQFHDALRCALDRWQNRHPAKCQQIIPADRD